MREMLLQLEQTPTVNHEASLSYAVVAGRLALLLTVEGVTKVIRFLSR